MKTHSIFNQNLSIRKPEKFLDLGDYNDAHNKIDIIQFIASDFAFEKISFSENDFIQTQKESTYEKMSDIMHKYNTHYKKKYLESKIKQNKAIPKSNRRSVNLDLDLIKGIRKFTDEKEMKIYLKQCKKDEKEIPHTEPNKQKKKNFMYTNTDVINYFKTLQNDGINLTKIQPKEKQLTLSNNTEIYKNENENVLKSDDTNTKPSNLRPENEYNTRTVNSNKIFFTETKFNTYEDGPRSITSKHFTRKKMNSTKATIKTEIKPIINVSKVNQVINSTQTVEKMVVNDSMVDEYIKFYVKKHKKAAKHLKNLILMKNLEQEIETISPVDPNALGKGNDFFVKSKYIKPGMTKFSKVNINHKTKAKKFSKILPKYNETRENMLTDLVTKSISYRTKRKEHIPENLVQIALLDKKFKEVENNAKNLFEEELLTYYEKNPVIQEVHRKETGYYNRQADELIRNLTMKEKNTKGLFLYSDKQGYHMDNYAKLYGIEKEIVAFINNLNYK